LDLFGIFLAIGGSSYPPPPLAYGPGYINIRLALYGTVPTLGATGWTQRGQTAERRLTTKNGVHRTTKTRKMRPRTRVALRLRRRILVENDCCLGSAARCCHHGTWNNTFELMLTRRATASV